MPDDRVQHLLSRIAESLGVMGMRDIIVHHYFEIDADVILSTVRDGIPMLLTVIRQMKQEEANPSFTSVSS